MALSFGKDGRGDRVCILSGSSLSKDGFSMQGDINMTRNKIINLPDPITNSESVTKSCADTHYSSGSGSAQQGPKGDKGEKGDTGLHGLTETTERKVQKVTKATQDNRVPRVQVVSQTQDLP